MECKRVQRTKQLSILEIAETSSGHVAVKRGRSGIMHRSEPQNGSFQDAVVLNRAAELGVDQHGWIWPVADGPLTREEPELRTLLPD